MLRFETIVKELKHLLHEHEFACSDEAYEEAIEELDNYVSRLDCLSFDELCMMSVETKPEVIYEVMSLKSKAEEIIKRYEHECSFECL